MAKEQIDVSVGSFTETIPFDIPDFYGIEPRLTLTYDSLRGNGLAGVGWQLQGPSVIERATPHRGSPQWDGNDIFLLDGQELVDCSTPGVNPASPSCANGGTHTTRVESYLRIKRDTSANNRWEITTRSGTTLTYVSVRTAGNVTPTTTEETRLVDQFRWLLKTATDAHGNTVSYSYVCPTPFPECYNTVIDYVGARILLYYESRPDPLIYATGSNLGGMYYRLNSVVVATKRDATASFFYVRTYDLTYAATAPADRRSRLASITQYGVNTTVDANGNIVQPPGLSLPPTALVYSTPSAAFTSTSWAVKQGPFIAGADWLTGDLNGDGKTDFVKKNVSSGCQLEVRLSTGTAFTRQAWTVTPSGGVGCQQNTGTWVAGDFNGDAKTDLAVYASSGGNWASYVYLSTGSSFNLSLWANVAAGYPANSIFLPGDFNGDGRTDFTRVITTGGCSLMVLTSTGSSFTSASRSVTGVAWWGSCLSNIGSTYETADANGDGVTDIVRRAYRIDTRVGVTDSLFFDTLLTLPNSFEIVSALILSIEFNSSEKWLRADVNGDGRVDLVRAYANGSTLSFMAYLAGGRGYAFQSNWASGIGTSSLVGTGMVWRTGDFNGDGLTDFAVFGNSPTTAGTYTVLISTQTAAHVVAQTWGSATGATDATVGDFDGDGKADIAVYWKDGTVTTADWSAKVNLSAGAVPDLLTNVTNSLGGRVTVEYRPSSAYTNTNLPFVTQAVSRITANDGRDTATSSAITDYSYAGGQWDAAERRFLGFGAVVMRIPCIPGETACPTKSIAFLKSRAIRATPYLVEERDGAGTLLRRAVNDFVVNESALPYSARMTATTTTTFEGAVSKSWKTTQKFDIDLSPTGPYFGNLVESTDHGDLSVSGDEITTATDYAPNTTKYIVSLPSRVRQFAGVGSAGTKLTENRISYDHLAWSTAATKGDPTVTEAWLDTENRFIASAADFDARGNVIWREDPLHNRFAFEYDTVLERLVTRTRDPLYFAGDLRHETTATWNYLCSHPDNEVDLNGQTTSTTTDVLCRPLRQNRPGGDFTANFYQNIGTPTGQWIETQGPPPDTSTVLFSRTVFDGFGRTWRTVKEGLPTSTILEDTTFDARGNVASQTAPYYAVGDTAQVTTFKYDTLNRRTERRYPSPDTNVVTGSYGFSTVTNGFEKSTIVETVSPGITRQVTVHTDAYGRKAQEDRVLNGQPVSTRYQYDLLGRLVGLTDNAGNQWSYTYDSLGRRLTASDPDMGLAPNFDWTYSYDDVGRLIEQTDALGQRTRMTYDGLGRVLTKTARFGTAQAEVTTYNYDQPRTGFFNVGHLTTVTRTVAGVTIAGIEYNHDVAGRLAQQTWRVPSASGEAVYTVGYSYDAGGRLLAQTYPDGDKVGTPGSATDKLIYDAGARLKSVPGVITDMTYNGRSLPLSVSRVNGVNSSYLYSLPRGWLTDIDTLRPGSIALQDLHYDRDGIGRITAVTSGISGTADQSWVYGYDTLDRLLSANNQGDNLLDQDFGYDSVGNMTSNSLVGSYTYPAGGAGVVRPHAVTATSGGPAAPESYGYDANGNLVRIGSGADTHTYDGENRLVRAPGAGGTIEFVYGPDGARLMQQAADGTVTLYLGADIEISGWSGPGTGTMTKYLPGNARRDGLCTPTTACTVWHHRDHLQSVRAVTDGAGAVKLLANYHPYGEREESLSLLTEAKGYIGERHDDDTGLMYLNARYYDPVLARFIQADPSDPSRVGVGVNRYEYSASNPVLYLDPSGFDWLDTSEMGVPVSEWYEPFRLADDYDTVAIPGGQIMAEYDTWLTGTYERFAADPYNGQAHSTISPLDFVGPGALKGPGWGLKALLGMGSARVAMRAAGGRAITAADIRAFLEVNKRGFWNVGVERGRVYEISRGANLPRAFKTIDKFEGGVATSFKAVDVRRFSDPAKLQAYLQRYVDELAEFEGASLRGYSVYPEQITDRVLDIAIPANSVNLSNLPTWMTLKSVQEEAAKLGIGVVYTAF